MSVGMIRKCVRSEIGYSAKPAFGIVESSLIWKNRNPRLTSSQKGLACTRNFSSFGNKIDTSPMDQISGRTGQLNRCSSNSSITIDRKRLPIPLKIQPVGTALCIPMLAQGGPCPSSLGTFLLAEEYISSRSPRHHESADFKYPKSTKKLSHSAPLLCSTLTIQYGHNRLNLQNKHPKPEISLWLPHGSRASSPSSYLEICRQTKPERSRDAYGISNKLREHEICQVSSYRGLRHPIPLRRAHLRGFHSTTVLLDKPNSDKPTGCREINDICETTKDDNDCGKPCEKRDACRREKIKCEKAKADQQAEQKKETPKEPEKGPLCGPCVPRGKCEIPKVDPPPKMTYKKVTCPSSKFAKLASCPPFQEDIKKNIAPRMEINLIKKKKKKKACSPPPLPKPPCAPLLLCPCPPPPKLHPGACPCYEHKSEIKQLMLPSCFPKKQYPCPTGVHYCPPKKCAKLQSCEKDRPNTRIQKS